MTILINKTLDAKSAEIVVKAIFAVPIKHLQVINALEQLNQCLERVGVRE